MTAPGHEAIVAQERLQKILARAGVASRRAAEEMILAGRVRVNGAVVDRLGTKADPERDAIRVDGKRITVPPAAEHVYFAAFKPRQMITSLDDPEGRPTVADLVRAARVRRRVYPVGRLDWDAEGLLLLTDDGELAHRLTHPRYAVAKVYRVRVKGSPDDRALERLRRGVTIEPGRRSAPAGVEVERRDATGTWLVVTIHEGRQNQIKKMMLAVGHPVRRLRRVAIGPLELGRMASGQVRPLTQAEIRRLRRAVGLDGGGEGGETGAPARSPRRAERQRRGPLRAGRKRSKSTTRT